MGSLLGEALPLISLTLLLWVGMSNAQSSCGTNCRNGCDLTTGVCSSCVADYYGDYCDIPCSGCINGACLQAGGVCIEGCIDGKYQPLCDANCDCPGPCNRQNGDCDCRGYLHCSSCDGNGCTQCSSQFYSVYEGHCCSIGCGTNDQGFRPCDYANDYSCLRFGGVCDNGFYGSTCISCSVPLPNCATCEVGANLASQPADCLTCEQEYTLSQDKTCCNQLCDNTCEDLMPNCGTCHESGSTLTCDTCKDASYSLVRSDMCCGANCLECDNSECLRCEAGYGPYPGKDSCDLCSVNCKARADGSARCDSSNRVCLTSCEFGWLGPTCEKPCDISNCYECGYIPSTDSVFCLECNNGYYGEQCPSCNSNCINSQCNNKTGECLIGCNDGFWDSRCESSVKDISGFINCATCNREGTICLTCDYGFNGETCEFSCSEHCVAGGSGLLCDKNTAECLNLCAPGWHRSDCNNKCGECSDVACDVNTAACALQVCTIGFYLTTCTAECSSNCASYSNGTKPCDINTGRCSLGCREGFYGDHCNSQCGNQCATFGSEQLGTCDQNTGTCNHGCNDGYYQFDCSSVCLSECVDETCDVTSGGCAECASTNPTPSYLCPSAECMVGKYGLLCDKDCAVNCVAACDRYSTKCDDCDSGWFADNCNQPCGQCKEVSCAQDSGTCVAGCLNGFYKPACTQICPDIGCAVCEIENGFCSQCKQGLYGSRCDISCSSNCNASQAGNLIYCSQFSGDCIPESCNDGHYGRRCDINCPPKCRPNAQGVRSCDFLTGVCADVGCEDGWYGERCDAECSTTCVTNVCERDGTCRDGCIDNRYGPLCKITCDTTCNDNACSRTTGNCTECDKGSGASPLCRTADCPAGKHGLLCSQDCADNCVNRECDRYSHVCDSCIGGFYGDTCNKACGQCADRRCAQDTGDCSAVGCKDGYYLSNCTSECVHRGCHTCDINNGQCYDCTNGKYGLDCSFDCSSNCVSAPALNCTRDVGHCIPARCQPSYFGNDCRDECGDNCGFVNGYRRCDFATGTCLADYCQRSWYGPTCGQRCSIHCVGQDCDRDGTCSHGCNVGWYGTDCNIVCAALTTCNDDTCDVQTGLCAECSSSSQPGPRCRTADCPVGTYGLFCEKTCPTFCQGQLCDRSSGDCAGCRVGYHGNTCDKTCPYCGGDDTCFENGICVSECDAGYFQLQCNETCLYGGCKTCIRESGRCDDCKNGRYGENCELECSPNCRFNSTLGVITCNKGTGICDNQCRPGYWDPTCTRQCSTFCQNGECELTTGQCTPCVIGYFGTTCVQTCSPRCKNNNCVTGADNCRDGCAIGYYGDRCQNDCSANCQSDECQQGDGSCVYGCVEDIWYGSTCGSRCNANCVNQKCEIGTGRCTQGCVAGTYGEQCQFDCTPVSMCNDDTCDRVTGVCAECGKDEPGPNCPSAGCAANKRGLTCEEPCPSLTCLFGRCERYEDTCIGCNIGLYGPYCNMTCTNCRDNSQCDQITGYCNQGCNDGYHGLKCNKDCNSDCSKCVGTTGECTECKPEKWGSACENDCSVNCQAANGPNGQIVCNKETGSCEPLSCTPGYYGDRCQQTCSLTCKSITNGQRYCAVADGTCRDGCLDTYYGNTCLERCSNRCEGQLCVDSATTCTVGCIQGAWDTDCSKNCSAQCVGGTCDVTGTCDSGCSLGFYGNNCTTRCVVACIDGYCDRPSGICDACKLQVIGSQCPIQNCDAGTYGPICEASCPGKNCLSNECDRSNGQCSTGCLPNFYGDFCLQPCECDATGSVQCNVDGSCRCRAGYFGSKCGSQCSAGCSADQCDQASGTCSQGCRQGYYGTDCANTCPNCINSNCNGADGLCREGCKQGYFGIRCDSTCPASCLSCSDAGLCTQCPDGLYGNICEHTCSVSCQAVTSGRLCNRASGFCLAGCRSGYWGPTCANRCGNCLSGSCDSSDGNCPGPCEVGYYGSSCSQTCSANCAASSISSNVCLKNSGNCQSGCTPQWYGSACSSPCNTNCLGSACTSATRCTSGCVTGYYGNNCGQSCSSNCRNTRCSSTGVCDGGCRNGFYGGTCIDACLETCLDGTCDVSSGLCPACSTSPIGNLCRGKVTVTTGVQQGLSSDAIAGIAGGAAGAVIIIFITCVLCFIYKRRADDARHEIHLPSEILERLSNAPSHRTGSVSNYPTARIIGEDALADKDFVLF